MPGGRIGTEFLPGLIVDPKASEFHRTSVVSIWKESLELLKVDPERLACLGDGRDPSSPEVLLP